MFKPVTILQTFLLIWMCDAAAINRLVSTDLKSYCPISKTICESPPMLAQFDPTPCNDHPDCPDHFICCWSKCFSSKTCMPTFIIEMATPSESGFDFNLGPNMQEFDRFERNIFPNHNKRDLLIDKKKIFKDDETIFEDYEDTFNTDKKSFEDAKENTINSNINSEANGNMIYNIVNKVFVQNMNILKYYGEKILSLNNKTKCHSKSCHRKINEKVENINPTTFDNIANTKSTTNSVTDATLYTEDSTSESKQKFLGNKHKVRDHEDWEMLFVESEPTTVLPEGFEQKCAESKIEEITVKYPDDDGITEKFSKMPDAEDAGKETSSEFHSGTTYIYYEVPESNATTESY